MFVAVQSTLTLSRQQRADFRALMGTCTLPLKRGFSKRSLDLFRPNVDLIEMYIQPHACRL